MFVFTYPAEKYNELNIRKTDILHLINKHITVASALKKKMDYYEG